MVQAQEWARRTGSASHQKPVKERAAMGRLGIDVREEGVLAREKGEGRPERTARYQGGRIGREGPGKNSGLGERRRAEPRRDLSRKV